MRASVRSELGFSLPEMLISVTLLLIISSVVTSALLQMTSSQRTIWNRTQLHAGVRSATELMQQEVGQAGRIALPGIQIPGTDKVSLSAPVVAGTTPATATLTTTAAAPLTGVSGIFHGELLVIDPGSWNQATSTSNEETVVVDTVNPATNTITILRSVDATGAEIKPYFVNNHFVGATVTVLGGFASGIVPPVASGFVNGSDGTHLKMYGDFNGDGKMQYVEYFCDTGTGNLYRNVMDFDQAPPKPAPTGSQVLLSNLQTNPGGTACFTYMPNPLPPAITGPDVSNPDPTVKIARTYVLDVAITLTVTTQLIDPITRQVQTETKALLNVSPRNVFNVWELASAGMFNRVQPMPPTVTALLP